MYDTVSAMDLDLAGLLQAGRGSGSPPTLPDLMAFSAALQDSELQPNLVPADCVVPDTTASLELDGVDSMGEAWGPLDQFGALLSSLPAQDVMHLKQEQDHRDGCGLGADDLVLHNTFSPPESPELASLEVPEEALPSLSGDGSASPRPLGWEDEMLAMETTQLNRYLARKHLSKEQKKAVKNFRRKLKNRNYAKTSRRRRLDKQAKLVDTHQEVSEQFRALNEKVSEFRRDNARLTRKLDVVAALLVQHKCMTPEQVEALKLAE
jgi:hypothetical protein